MENLMAYLIKNLGWGNREVLIFVIAHIVLLAWAIALILNTKTMSSGSLLINYTAIFSLGLMLVKQNNKLEKKTNDLEG